MSLLARTLLGAALVAPLTAGATAGFLDPGFAGDGVLVLNASAPSTGENLLYAGLIDHAGRYVGAGQSASAGDLTGAVVRVTRGGAPDPAFGNGGVVRFQELPGFGHIRWVEIAEMADGRLVVAGRAANAAGLGDPGRVVVCRLLETGTPDPSFDGDGCVTPTFANGATRESVSGMAVQPDGKIVLTGLSNALDDIAPLEWVVARLDEDGSYDLCFGDVACLAGGVRIEPEPDGDISTFLPADLALAPDGRIVIAGRAQGVTADFAVVRLLANGNVDAAGFGNQGHRLVAFDNGGTDLDAATSIAIRSDGAIFLTGTVSNDFGVLGGVAALDEFGAPLPGFGTQGKMMVNFNDVSPLHLPTRISLQGDGKLLIAGTATDSAVPGSDASDCGIARVLPNGTLDPTFAFNGVNGVDSTLGVQTVADVCEGLDLDGERIELFGGGAPTPPSSLDALFLAFDQDGVFADGFEP